MPPVSTRRACVTTIPGEASRQLPPLSYRERAALPEQALPCFGASKSFGRNSNGHPNIYDFGGSDPAPGWHPGGDLSVRPHLLDGSAMLQFDGVRQFTYTVPEARPQCSKLRSGDVRDAILD